MIDNYIKNMPKIKDMITHYINNITITQLFVIYLIYLIFGNLIKGLIKASLYTVVVFATIYYMYNYLENNK